MATYFLRRAGKVEGPFTLEKVLAEVRLKKLAKFHELSPDGISWQKASDFPEVFPATEVKAKVRPEAALVTELKVQTTESPLPSAGSTLDWYYELNNQEKGPVKFSTVTALVENGTLSPKSLVWFEKLDQWQPVSSVVDLQPFLPSANSTLSWSIDVTGHKSTGSRANRSWHKFGIKAALLMIGLACVGLAIYAYRQSSGDDVKQTAIYAVLQNEQNLGRTKLGGENAGEIADSIRTFVADASAQELKDCPPDFRVAYRRYVESMSELARTLDKLPDTFEEGVLLGMLNFASDTETDGAANGLTGELASALKNAEASWRHVEDIALEHDVAL